MLDSPNSPHPDGEDPPRDRGGHRLHPCFALAAYADDLVTGARVAVFGDATHDLPMELLERGARLVHVYDFDPARIAEATARGHEQALYYGALRDEGDIGVRDGAFDLAVVPDLSFSPRPEELIALLARVVSPAGAAIVASPNAEARGAPPSGPGRLGYYELYDAFAKRFPRVRMIGQVPFFGWAMAEFAAGEDLEPTIDSSLVDENREPLWFVVLASTKGVRLESYALVETPSPEPIAVAEAVPERGDPAVLEALEKERDEARAALEDARRDTEQERLRATHAEMRLAAVGEETTLLRDRAATLQMRLEGEQQRLGELEQIAGQGSAEHETDIGRLEKQLSACGREIAEARAELSRRERLLREILARGLGAAAAEPVGQGEAASDGAAAARSTASGASFEQLGERLDRLAAEVSRREADLVAAAWKIAQLERKLERTHD